MHCAFEGKLGLGPFTYSRKDFYDINFQGALALGGDGPNFLTIAGLGSSGDAWPVSIRSWFRSILVSYSSMRNEVKRLTTLAQVAPEGYVACNRESRNSADAARARSIWEFARGNEVGRRTCENPDVNLLDRGDYGRVKGVRDD